MRTDTEPPMRKGKMVAQGAHASISFLTRNLQANGYTGTIQLTQEAITWMEEGFTKICCKVETLEELQRIYNEALAKGLTAYIIEDSPDTEFKVPTITCVAIGPNYSEEIDKLTGHLKLL